MNTAITRRQMLASTACALIAAKVGATPTCSESQQIVRQIVSWIADSIDLRCWFEGFATEVPRVVEDAQAVWSHRALVHHLEFQDLEWLLMPHQTRGLPLLRVGSATSRTLSEAAETAFIHSGGIKICDKGKLFYAGWLLVSVPDERLFLDSLKGIRSWMFRNMPDGAFFGTQFLVDPSLENDKKRVSVVIAT